jgi:hypothetical protein
VGEGAAGASGSSISVTSSTVPGGGVVHCRRGRRLAPSQVNSRGKALRGRSGLEAVSREDHPRGRCSLSNLHTLDRPGRPII